MSRAELSREGMPDTVGMSEWAKMRGYDPVSRSYS
jgi:hypothetical protein